jgi:hypothetical protein
MPPRLCTSCPVPHETADWYVVEYNHPRHGEIECAEAHERRIPLEVRDFGCARPKTPVVKPGRRRQVSPGDPSLAELLRLP